MATIHIHSGKSSSDNIKEISNIQSIPFKIEADCESKVSNYFNTYIRTRENGTVTASFRGYPLKGKNIVIPDGYIGRILYETFRPETEKSERKFYITKEFSKITYWNWDKEPSDNDSVTQALQWIDIAEALHSPILEE